MWVFEDELACHDSMLIFYQFYLTFIKKDSGELVVLIEIFPVRNLITEPKIVDSNISQIPQNNDK